jgi:hypothetical protein
MRTDECWRDAERLDILAYELCESGGGSVEVYYSSDEMVPCRVAVRSCGVHCTLHYARRQSVHAIAEKVHDSPSYKDRARTD